MLAIGPKVCGFQPGQGNGFLRPMKICSIPSFGGEVKPEAPCHLWHVKYHAGSEQKYFTQSNLSFPSPVPPVCYQMTAVDYDYLIFCLFVHLYFPPLITFEPSSSVYYNIFK
jgi:hypothetical protein